MATVGSFLYFLLLVALIVLIARFVLDWVQMLARQWRPRGFIAVVCEGIYSITDPPLRMVRGVIPPIRLGSVALDLSPLILIIAINILMAVVRAVFS